MMEKADMNLDCTLRRFLDKSFLKVLASEQQRYSNKSGDDGKRQESTSTTSGQLTKKAKRGVSTSMPKMIPMFTSTLTKGKQAKQSSPMIAPISSHIASSKTIMPKKTNATKAEVREKKAKVAKPSLSQAKEKMKTANSQKRQTVPEKNSIIQQEKEKNSCEEESGKDGTQIIPTTTPPKQTKILKPTSAKSVDDKVNEPVCQQLPHVSGNLLKATIKRKKPTKKAVAKGITLGDETEAKKKIKKAEKASKQKEVQEKASKLDMRRLVSSGELKNLSSAILRTWLSTNKVSVPKNRRNKSGLIQLCEETIAARQ
eukprot:m.91879 g.91879  ORF g.91879 m.91879 type:complete len:314 (-) comp12340_c0_seq1:244-1185(-)